MKCKSILITAKGQIVVFSSPTMSSRLLEVYMLFYFVFQGCKKVINFSTLVEGWSFQPKYNTKSNIFYVGTGFRSRKFKRSGFLNAS